MCKFFFVFFIFLSQLFAAYEAQLSDFDKNFISSNEKLRFHHQLQNLYVQSIINEDEKSKTEILKRLVISSNTLNLDDSSYVAELKQSGLTTANIKNLQANNTAKNSNTKSSQNTSNKNENKTLFVLGVKTSEDGLELGLSANLDKEDLKIFELEEKTNFRYVIDFEAALDVGRKNFSWGDIDGSIAQFNPKTTRLVLHAKTKFKPEISFANKSLMISFKISQSSKITQEPKKEVQKQVQKANQKPLFVLKSSKENAGITLVLSDELEKDELKSFTMKAGGAFRQIFDFEATLEGGRKNFNFGKNSITLTQYTPKIVRVVLNSNKNFKPVLNFEDKKLYMGFENLSTKAQPKQNTSNPSQSQQVSVSKTENKAPARSFRASKTIVIDAGHGGKDAGALGAGGKLFEKTVVLNTALKLGNELKKRGYKVYYTRTKDTFINLRDRTKVANNKRANLFISIHANAAPNKNKAATMQGVETFFLSPARSERSREVAAQENQSDVEEMNYFGKQTTILHSLSRDKIIASNKLAIDVQKGMLSALRKKYKIIDGGVREAPFWVLVGAQDMPAILIEMGYITHPEEGKRLANNAFQESIADGIADGIDNYFYYNP
ncbi:N-acetylmuramoyl-L-alanine amidase [Campylobacter sp. MIT 99-7217]|uniref:N-acetylmuramoyl-L-alanine amidase family protein n=1 Tax=Campylobacter sp. MIT 99-7217 TaxID=535091 RepID=UPI00115C32C8|nr:N-acetylmuramoyl-L-alanine amidase [Campylobacter sp. MIT 99-7217]TQR33779.1 N-acetylmuramoyl-L-alanine amidase [Campylobacter sp. MIT 99-7217]